MASTTHAAEAPTFVLSRWLFLRLLALVYLIAFSSLGVQVVGLIGARGLLPAATFLDNVRSVYGNDAYLQFPTLAWLGSSDASLAALCWGGAGLSILAALGMAPRLLFVLLWGLYLSLTVVGQSFLSFQWDVLLLETGLVACLYAPGGWWPALATVPAPLAVVRWTLWGLAFKLTLLSGVTKLVSGDPTWRGLTALTFHYQTQPLPAWTSWYAHHWPSAVHRAAAAGTFAVELGVAFAILLPGRYRHLRMAACAGLCALQIGIAATGNYGFFNLLTIVLYLSMLDDGLLRRLWRGQGPFGDEDDARRPVESRPWQIGLTSLALAVSLGSGVALWREATYTRPHPLASRVLSLVAPLRSINGYGLFRTMTTSRPEIIVEGSDDGLEWREYEFRWKPGRLDRRPEFVQPHMPRLDWQLWFAALDPSRESYLLSALAIRLLEGSASVQRLVGGTPFPDGPPRYIRLVLYDYEFSTGRGEDAASGDWWRRERRRPLTGPLSLPTGMADARTTLIRSNGSTYDGARW